MKFERVDGIMNMISIIVIGVIVVIFLLMRTIYQSSDAARMKNTEPPTISEFGRSLSQVGLSKNVVTFTLDLIRLMQERDTLDTSVIKQSTMTRLMTYDYSHLYKELTYVDIYERNKQEFDSLLDKVVDESGLTLDEMSEHIEGWSKPARIAEVVITDRVAAAIDNYFYM